MGERDKDYWWVHREVVLLGWIDIRAGLVSHRIL